MSGFTQNEKSVKYMATEDLESPLNDQSQESQNINTDELKFQFCTKNCGTKPFVEKKRKLLRGKKTTNYKIGKR
tara:strand:- start:5561 stop:5782 length:222 start_codon:yes stop_codon:yes gene_type:complete